MNINLTSPNAIKLNISSVIIEEQEKSEEKKITDSALDDKFCIKMFDYMEF